VPLYPKTGATIRAKALILAVFAALLIVSDARTARQPSQAETAIRYVFGPYATQALRVAYCESRYSIWARNGQYLGLFQMGEYARSRYGHAWNAWAQAISAWRYFVDSGRDWSPWACRPR
jgi:hypothetical protein